MCFLTDPGPADSATASTPQRSTSSPRAAQSQHPDDVLRRPQGGTGQPTRPTCRHWKSNRGIAMSVGAITRRIFAEYGQKAHLAVKELDVAIDAAQSGNTSV